MRGWNCIKSFCILGDGEHEESVAVHYKITGTAFSEKRKSSMREASLRITT